MWGAIELIPYPYTPNWLNLVFLAESGLTSLVTELLPSFTTQILASSNDLYCLAEHDCKPIVRTAMILVGSRSCPTNEPAEDRRPLGSGGSNQLYFYGSLLR